MLESKAHFLLQYGECVFYLCNKLWVQLELLGMMIPFIALGNILGAILEPFKRGLGGLINGKVLQIGAVPEVFKSRHIEIPVSKSGSQKSFELWELVESPRQVGYILLLFCLFRKRSFPERWVLHSGGLIYIFHSAVLLSLVAKGEEEMTRESLELNPLFWVMTIKMGFSWTMSDYEA